MQQAQTNGVNNIVDMWNGTALWSSWDGAITFKTLPGNGFAAARCEFLRIDFVHHLCNGILCQTLDFAYRVRHLILIMNED